MSVQPLGRRIAQARVDAGLSQHQLAERLGLSKSWVDKVERGIRAIDKVAMRARLAEALGQDPDVLFAEPAAFYSSPPPRPAEGSGLDAELLRLISEDVGRPESVLGGRLREMYDSGHPGFDRALLQLHAFGLTQQTLAQMAGITRQGIGYRLSRFDTSAHDLPVRDVTLSDDETAWLRDMHARGARELNAKLLLFHQRGVAKSALADALGVHEASIWRRIRMAESHHRPVWTVAADPTPIPSDTAVRLRELHAAGDPRLWAELTELHKSGCWKKHLAEVLGITPTGVSYLIKRATS